MFVVKTISSSELAQSERFILIWTMYLLHYLKLLQKLELLESQLFKEMSLPNGSKCTFRYVDLRKESASPVCLVLASGYRYRTPVRFLETGFVF